MAKEPDNLVLHLLRENRKVQDADAAELLRVTEKLSHLTTRAGHLTERVEDLHTISTHTLGVAANAHVRYETPERKVNDLSTRVERLEAKR
jgi:hypothetical protein